MRKNRLNNFVSRIVTFAVALTAMVAPAIISSPAAQAAVRSQVVLHVPGDPRVVPNTTVSADTGSGSTEYDFVAGDSYGAFAFIPTFENTIELTIEGKDWNVFDGTEVWMDESGELHSSRALAQGHVIVRYRSATDSGLVSSLTYTDVAADTTLEINPATGSTAAEAIFEVPVTTDTKRIELQPKVSGSPMGSSRAFDARKWGEVWISDDFGDARFSEAWADGYAVFHYNRPEGDYKLDLETGCEALTGCNAWGLHVWDGAANASEVTWANPLDHEAIDEFGLVFRVPLVDGAENLSFLFHSGDTKDPGNNGAPVDQSLNLAMTGGEVWFVSENSDAAGKAVYAVPVIQSVDADLTVLRAIWVTPGVIAWPDSIRTVADGERGIRAHLLYDAAGEIEVSENPETRRLTVIGDDARWPLTSGSTLPSGVLDTYRHLSKYRALNVPTNASNQIKQLLKGQLAVLVTDNSITPANPNGDELLVRLTGIQLAPVLDNIYGAAAVGEELGITWNGNVPTMRVWAPTAKAVRLERFDNASADTSATNHDMELDTATGVWSVTGDSSWKNQYFQYEVDVYAHSKAKVVTNTVTDPYSVSLSMNSLRTQIFDPADPTYMPEGWDANRPDFTSMKDASIYELHIRDFSVIDETVDEDHRGKYLAFTDKTSAGMLHLKQLADAGLTHLHLLPTFDIASVDEDASTWESPGDLSGYDPDSEEQQAAVAAIANKDGFNWGYDPFHFNAPEGSYAVEVDGGARILEFRKMIQ
ncbi:MAG: hypothetical protein RL038_207, partial [Actinomycetota bacterium]